MVDSVLGLTPHSHVGKAHLHPELLPHSILWFLDEAPLALPSVHSELKQLPPELMQEWFS